MINNVIIDDTPPMKKHEEGRLRRGREPWRACERRVTIYAHTYCL